MIRRPPRSTLSSSSAASDVYKRQVRDSHGPGAKFVKHTDGFLDKESKIRNDPMLAIKRREEEALKEVTKNSFLMSEIKSEAKSMRKDKKLDKKLKKAMKKAEKKAEKKSGKESKRERSRSPYDRRRSRSPARRVDSMQERRRSRSPRRPEARRERTRSPAARRERTRSPSPKKQRGGGLQAAGGKSEIDKELGPRSLMDWEHFHAQKRKETEAKRKAEGGGPKDERRADGYGQRMGRSGNMSSASNGYTSKMSEEEKARKLAAMRGDADVHMKKVAETAAKSKADLKREEAEHLSNKHAQFINEVKGSAFGMEHDIGMEEANRRKANTRQKGNKDEAASWKR
eukprot:TRINITY_DN33509_c0_g1_i3.p1 TRINITY_DN33509_c0_g1~~TRINITY_DN33509_c0_g1_i3.p1  ORF type:complete len:343 (-),score=87.61 TRINITY_DN33509_c0_g1_i3:105-1133(-)